MDYFVYLLKKSIIRTVVTIVLLMVLWGTLYSLTDAATVSGYFWCGVAVCSLNTVLINLKKGKFENLISVNSLWIIFAGVVLVLYHAGFYAAAVFTAAAIMASPFFGASVFESIVGLTLLIMLAKMMN